MTSYGLSVSYENESWQTKGLTVRLSLFSALKAANPEKIITITKEGRPDKKVPIKDLTLN